MPYTRPYAAGFVDFPLTSTPIDSTALNTMDVGIKTSNDQFQSVTTTERNAIAAPIVGQCVWDSDLRQLMVYMNATTGNAWQPIGNSIVCASTTRPVTPFEGQQIYETDTNRSWTYNGAAFVPNDNVFTTEAARDAAITSPTEGMIAYLTASTVAAAVGDTYAATPTGIRTIYNGSVWVCVTEIGATTNTTGTTTSSAYTPTLTSGGTNPAVTLVTGTQALVSMSMTSSQTSIANHLLSFAVSGATTLAAADAQGTGITISNLDLVYRHISARTLVITGLTAGTNTFTLNYLTGGGTMSARFRSIVVKGIA